MKNVKVKSKLFKLFDLRKFFPNTTVSLHQKEQITPEFCDELRKALNLKINTSKPEIVVDNYRRYSWKFFANKDFTRKFSKFKSKYPDLDLYSVTTKGLTKNSIIFIASMIGVGITIFISIISIF